MCTRNLFLQILRDTRGATAIEYGLILALVVIAMITAMDFLGNETIAMWNGVETKVDDAVSPRS